MAERGAGSRLAAALWIAAAVLALGAAGVGYARRGEMRWAVAAAGVFCAVMAVSAWTRGRQPPDR